MPKETITIVTLDLTIIRAFTSFDVAVDYVKFVYKSFDLVKEVVDQDSPFRRFTFCESDKKLPRWIVVREMNIDDRL